MYQCSYVILDVYIYVYCKCKVKADAGLGSCHSLPVDPTCVHIHHTQLYMSISTGSSVVLWYSENQS